MAASAAVCLSRARTLARHLLPKKFDFPEVRLFGKVELLIRRADRIRVIQSLCCGFESRPCQLWAGVYRLSHERKNPIDNNLPTLSVRPETRFQPLARFAGPKERGYLGLRRVQIPSRPPVGRSLWDTDLRSESCRLRFTQSNIGWVAQMVEQHAA